MMRTMLKSKLSYATIIDAHLYYKGSITIDENLMEAADLREHEKVSVLNLNNGARLKTYVIKGKRNSGMICLNGPAARLGCKGDKVIVLSYGLYNEEELKSFKTTFVEVDEKNNVKNTHLAG
ncbi:MAG: aspartate 1-decarboxylase [Candidatus Omnitrophica bacterium]|nr:aspartate 1-decarboxylase [Candidatus Omnitrophota bacterium]